MRGGFGRYENPDFDLEMRIDQAPLDPRNYVLTTAITQLRNDAIAADSRFHHCFNHHCNELVVYFTQAIDLEDKIDRIEAIDALAACLDYAPDASEFELRLPELDLQIRVTGTAMSFQLLGLSNLAKLLEHSQKAFEILTAAGFGLKLGSA